MAYNACLHGVTDSIYSQKCIVKAKLQKLQLFSKFPCGLTLKSPLLTSLPVNLICIGPRLLFISKEVSNIFLVTLWLGNVKCDCE